MERLTSIVALSALISSTIFAPLLHNHHDHAVDACCAHAPAVDAGCSAAKSRCSAEPVVLAGAEKASPRCSHSRHQHATHRAAGPVCGHSPQTSDVIPGDGRDEDSGDSNSPPLHDHNCSICLILAQQATQTVVVGVALPLAFIERICPRTESFVQRAIEAASARGPPLA